jgi:hypothetical protein
MNKQMLLIGMVGLLVALLLASVAFAQTSTNFDLSWHVLAGGGGRADSTHYAMNGTAGQAVVGFSDNASYGMQSGYWSGTSLPGYGVYLPLVLRGYP